MNTVTLSDLIIDLESGSRPRGGRREEGIPSLGGGELNDEGGFDFEKLGYIPEDYYKELSRGVIEINDILIVKDGATTGKVAYVSKKFPFKAAAVNSHVFRVKVDPKKALSKYVFYYLFSQKGKQQILEDHRGATVGGISQGFVDYVSIPLPSLEVQQQIVEILDEAKNLLNNRKKTKNKVTELVDAVFYKKFGDPVSNSKKWSFKKLSEVGDLSRGKSTHRPRNAPELLGGPYPLIQTGDVSNSDGYISSYTDSYSELGLEQSKMWKKGTLCITIAANIAKTGILTFDACFPDSVVGFHPYEKVVTTEYVQSWMSCWQKILEDSAPESAQKNINLRILRDLDITVPPYNLQKEFSAFVKEVRKNKKAINKSTKRLDNLFNSLLQKAFNGELV